MLQGFLCKHVSSAARKAWRSHGRLLHRCKTLTDLPSGVTPLVSESVAFRNSTMVLRRCIEYIVGYLDMFTNSRLVGYLRNKVLNSETFVI